MSNSVEEENKKNKSTVNKKRKDNSVKVAGEKKRNKSKKIRKSEEKHNAFVDKFGQPGAVEDGDGVDNLNGKSKKVRKKRKKDQDSSKVDELMEKKREANQDEVSRISSGDEDCLKGMKSKSKKVRKKRKKDQDSSKVDELMEKKREADQDEVSLISSGDEDCSKGMKKWITEYHQSRPGLKVLQQRIDEFIITHEAQVEQERKEREAQAAEGGWTVVVHHKGRKKTTDSESGIAVGSVAQAVLEDKLAKKKKKDVGLDFYRFQRRESQRNEIMMLRSKFEQDRKRIQQLRAARKFKPY
ncbi:hypothetical protein LWI29_000339 [Acer saccharum]|uniref:Ribosomal RNA-processing protein 7 C-terminal domain-containing protein n=1 Tax=Acer saccharum TaxID=4024 RepID=A0AA39RG52_ACESA|nr:hypothetical protein LWI29_000339 [Acer saccharum]